jgi:succinyl-CoA synthetase beta subunit
MRLYEYEAKGLFREFGIPVPGARVVNDPEELKGIAGETEYPVMLKAQVLTGGRGKAGGVRAVEDAEELLREGERILGLTIRGFPVRKLLIEDALAVSKELYLGIAVDRAAYALTVIASGEGGVEIERVAEQRPEAVHRLTVGIDERFYAHQGVALGRKIGLEGDLLSGFAAVVSRLLELYRKLDVKMAEINPLVVTTDGELIAADARVNADDDSLFRQPRLKALVGGGRHEEGELTPREKKARELGIPYLDLDGDVGMFPGGAGFGIMGNDFIHRFGGRPANFMDSGGGPTPERLADMLKLLDDNSRVRAIFGARFGGVSRCDDFAKGVVKFLKEHGLSKPMALRFTGNMWREGVRIFTEEKERHPELFEKIEFFGIETPIETVAKRAVELARKATV